MSKILKGLNEVNPNNYDSDWDYQDAVAKSGRSRSSYRSQEDDTSDADIAYSKKMYQLGQKQKAAKEKAQRDSDHDRLASGTNEGMMPLGGTSTTTDRRKVMDLLQVYYKSMGGDFWEWFNQPGNKEFFAKRAEVSPDSAYEVVDSINWGQHPEEEWPKDEEEQLDELSNKKLGQYKTAAGADASKADSEGDYKRGDKRVSGIIKATKKEFANDTKTVKEDINVVYKKAKQLLTQLDENTQQRVINALQKKVDDEQPPEPFKTGYPRVNNPKILGTQNRAKTAYYPPSKPNVKKLDKPLPENLGNELKSKSLEALQQVKQKLEQQRMADLEQWEKDFKQNTVSKFTAREPNFRQRATSTSMVAMPGEKHSELKARLSQLDKAIEKQGILDNLVQKLDKKGLMTPNIEAGVDTSMLARDGARDNYVELNKKLDKALEYVKNRLLTNKAAYAKPKAIDENDSVPTRMKMSDYYDLADNIQEKLKQAIQTGDKARIQELNKQRDELDAHVKKHGMMPENVAEEWSQKYKSSINCSHPKGFSQKAHCAGKKKHNESIDNVMEMTCPDCGMCETHVDHTNLDEACWKGYHKEGNKKMFGKTYPNCVKNTNEEQLDEKCWDTHKQVGMKNKGGKQVPNCVPKESIAEGMPSDNDMGSTTGGAKMTLGQWKQMWMKKMPNADFAAMFRSPPNMRGSAIAYFDGWVNNPDARWDPQQGVTEEKCPHCNGPMFSEMIMNEKKDACYYKVKSRYKVWPSAYASGALVKCRKKGASNWGTGGKKNESSILEGIEQADESLHDWFNKEKWVRMDTKGKIKGPCAREPGEGKPKCLPQAKAHSLGKKGRASAAQRKRREDPNPERSGKAINVDTKKSKG